MADFEPSTVHHQQARHRLTGCMDHLSPMDGHRSDEFCDAQLLLVRESLEDRDTGDTQIILEHVTRLSQHRELRPSRPPSEPLGQAGIRT